MKEYLLSVDGANSLILTGGNFTNPIKSLESIKTFISNLSEYSQKDNTVSNLGKDSFTVGNVNVMIDALAMDYFKVILKAYQVKSLASSISKKPNKHRTNAVNVIVIDNLLKELNEALTSNDLTKIKEYTSALEEKITFMKENKSFNLTVNRNKSRSGFTSFASSILLGLYIIGGAKSLTVAAKSDQIPKNSTEISIMIDEQVEDTPIIEIETKELNNSAAQMQFIGLNDLDDLSWSSKFTYVQGCYYQIFDKYEEITGNSANLMMALATQEKGYHEPIRDVNGDVGICQINPDVWLSQDANGNYQEYLDYYDFKDNKWKSFLFDEGIYELDQNIFASNVIMQNNLKMFKGNLIAALYAYNWGPTATKEKIKAIAKEYNMDYNDFLINPPDYNWISAFDLMVDGPNGTTIKVNYALDVLRYLPKDKPISFTYIDDDENISTIVYMIYSHNLGEKDYANKI